MSHFDRFVTEPLDVFSRRAIKAFEAIDRVRELHKPIRDSLGLLACAACSDIATMANAYEVFIAFDFCPTIKALDGDTE